MKRLCVVVSFSLAAMITPRTVADEPPEAAVDRNAAASAVSDSAASDSAAASGAAAQQGETWRYKRHNGAWWYWLPSEKWVYWTGTAWAPYDAKSFAQFRAAQRPSYYNNNNRSGSYPADQGNWGPMRYNGYGQPEWPYSQRRSGLRQLGPVPAMGGVRSLPGWGGER